VLCLEEIRGNRAGISEKMQEAKRKDFLSVKNLSKFLEGSFLCLSGKSFLQSERKFVYICQGELS